jgi:hypothetical protein
MTTQEIQRLQETKPFQSYRVLVADGRHFDVQHPESLAISGNGRLISIGMADYFVTLDLLRVTGIEKPIPPRRNGKRSRRAN